MCNNIHLTTLQYDNEGHMRRHFQQLYDEMRAHLADSYEELEQVKNRGKLSMKIRENVHHFSPTTEQMEIKCVLTSTQLLLQMEIKVGPNNKRKY